MPLVLEPISSGLPVGTSRRPSGLIDGPPIPIGMSRVCCHNSVPVCVFQGIRSGREKESLSQTTTIHNNNNKIACEAVALAYRY